MKYFIALLLSLGLFGFALNAQNAMLSGVVKDYHTGETIIGANILYGKGKGTVSDIYGKYTLILPHGKYRLIISHVGYITDTIDITLNTTDHYLDLKLKTQTLSEVEVVADIAISRETPVAFTNVTPKQLEEELAARDLPLILNRTPGVYATQQGGGDGDARINIRGFNQRNVAVMVDGIPVNDMENGWVYWSNWFGLDVVTRTIQVQRGLGASKLAIPSVGGTLNIITSGIEAKKGATVKQEIGSDGYLRTTLGLTSGKLKNGWGVSFSGAYKKGNGWVDQNWTEGWFYFLGVDKQLGNHLLSFSAMGAPQEHGQRSYKDYIAAYDVDYAQELGVSEETIHTYDSLGIPLDKGLRYNEFWGKLDRYTINDNGDTIHGEMETINTKKNFYHKPLFTFKDLWNVNKKLYISNIAYLSIGNGGGTGLTSTPNPTPEGQVNIQSIYDANYAALGTNTAGKGDAIYASVNNHFWYGLLSSFSYSPHNVMEYSGGIDLRYYKGEHYREVYDLLGAEFYTDEEDQFTLLNKTNPSTRREKGNKIEYNNDGLVQWGGLFFQAEYKLEKLTAFFNISGAYSGYKRIDYFKKKDLVLDDTTIFQAVGYSREFQFPNGWVAVPDTVFHKGQAYTIHSPEARHAQTDWEWFPSYTLKGGVNYNISQRSNIFMNLGYINKAPRFNNVFDYDNNLYVDIQNEQVRAVELGYSYVNPELTINLNTYYTNWLNKPSDFGVSLQDPDDEDNYLKGNINGMDAMHMGVELELGYRITPSLIAETVLAVADWRWKSGDTVRFYDEKTQSIEASYYFDAEDVHVGDAAQIQIRESLRYEYRKRLYLSASLTYFGKHYANFDPLSLSPDYPYAPENYNFYDDDGKPKDSWKVPDYYLVDFHAGYNVDYKGVKFQFSASVLNVLNRMYISDAQNNDRYLSIPGYSFNAASASVFFGMGRRYMTSIKLKF